VNDADGRDFECRQCGYPLRDLPETNRTITCPECGHRNAVADLSRIGAALPWPGAIGLSVLVVYGPFLVLALYALGFVPCAHCRAATWTILPCAPGLLPVDAARLWIDLPQSLRYTLAFVVSLAMVLSLSGLVRHGGWLRLAAALLALATFSGCAVAILAMIQA
jgi:DNA-directed RNA polymerase subunit RPC12/RpoP